MSVLPDWLQLAEGRSPLLVSIPHTGTDIPETIEKRLVSAWLGRKDADWWIERLYGFAAGLDATVIRTAISRTVIDVNRDPSGASLYPGQATTELCPTTTFDGEPLYRAGCEPETEEIKRRRRDYFDPYHAALADQIARLRRKHPCVVLYDCHSIRSVIPRLFDGELPHFNIGTNDGHSCDRELLQRIERICKSTRFTSMTNGRFRGGWITRHYGRPADGIHAVQMELACRGYMADPAGPLDASTWPARYDASFAAPMRAVLEDILNACLAFAAERSL
jgi:formiminoglutamase